MTQQQLEQFEQNLTQLLTGEPGATLTRITETSDPDTWVLARHHRLEEDVLWIRPVYGETLTEGVIPVFPLGDLIRRGINPDRIEINTPDHIRIREDHGAVFDIEAITGETHCITIERWDTFMLTVLTAEEELALDSVNNDSWHGRYP